jgi:TorA maturation chaperone TorD
MSDSRGTLTGSDLARMRQGCYRVLAAGFSRPSQLQAEQIQTGLALLEDLGLGMFSFTASLRRWDTVLTDAAPTAVAGEYVRLFGSGMDGAVCPPVESQQLGVNLVGDAARHAGRIEDLMRRAGFETQLDDRPPDHIVVELELASALCAAEAKERAAGGTGREWLERQMELIAVLGFWVPGFAVTVGERDRTGVYAALCEATAAFVLHENDLARMLLEAAGETEA